MKRAMLIAICAGACGCGDGDSGDGDSGGGNRTDGGVPDGGLGEDPPVSAVDDATLDGLYAALRSAATGDVQMRLEAAAAAVEGACDALIADALAPAIVIADAVRETVISVRCADDATWPQTVADAIDDHDGESWLVIELTGSCEVPTDEAEDAVFRLEGVARVELRGQVTGGDSTRVDARAWSTARADESILVEIADSEDVVVRDLELSGLSTATEDADAGGIRVHGSSRVVIEDNVLTDIGVDYDAIGHPDSGNAFAIKITGDPGEVSRQVLVRNNVVRGLRTGQSENITVAGDVADFGIAGNIIVDVDNIGIDLIGGEDYDGAQARDGFVCGNGMGAQRPNNPAYEDGDAAGAGVYLDGGGNGSLIAFNVVEGYARGYEVGAEESNPTVRNVHLVGNVSIGARGAGLLVGSLAERADASVPTDTGTWVERHLVVRTSANRNDDISTCVAGATNDDEGAAQCEAGSVDRRGVDICVTEAMPGSVAACTWHADR